MRTFNENEIFISIDDALFTFESSVYLARYFSSITDLLHLYSLHCLHAPISSTFDNDTHVFNRFKLNSFTEKNNCKISLLTIMIGSKFELSIFIHHIINNFIWIFDVTTLPFCEFLKKGSTLRLFIHVHQLINILLNMICVYKMS